MGYPKEAEKHLGDKYKNGETYYKVVGYIDRPAICLADPITGETKTVVIGCWNHTEMEKITDSEAVQILEEHFRKDDTP